MLKRIVRALSVAGVSALVLVILAQAALACDPGSSYPSKSDDSHFAGYNLTDTPPTSGAGVQATILTYNSFTVINDSVWVMAIDDQCSVSGKCYAQTGYIVH